MFRTKFTSKTLNFRAIRDDQSEGYINAWEQHENETMNNHFEAVKSKQSKNKRDLLRNFSKKSSKISHENVF